MVRIIGHCWCFHLGLEADLTLSAVPFQAHLGENSLLFGTFFIHTGILLRILLVAGGRIVLIKMEFVDS